MPFSEVHFTSKAQDWATPWPLFRQVDHEFAFTLDVCAEPGNAKCPRYFTIEDDGLSQDWGTNVCWCNPPYAHVEAWARKAWMASEAGATVVMLTFARTDTKWFHRYVLGKGAELRFIQGRIKFEKAGATNSAPSPSCLIIYRARPNLS